MRRVASFAIITSLIAVPVHAAQDSGPSYSAQPARSSVNGVGAQASVTLKFGDRRTVRGSQRLALGIAAGPVVTVPVRGQARQGVTNLIGFTVRPGYVSSLQLAGQPIVTHYTRLGAAEAEGQEGGEEPRRRKGPSTVGWVAIGLGVTAIAVVGVGYYLLVNGCGGNGCDD